MMLKNGLLLPIPFNYFDFMEIATTILFQQSLILTTFLILLTFLHLFTILNLSLLKQGKLACRLHMRYADEL